MYLDHYGLREPPFAITPDPRFVYLSERHREALAHLLYGIGQGGGGGFAQLTGEVGTGKTTISRLLLEQLPGHVRVALVLNPMLAPVELLETISEELRLPMTGRRGSLKALVDGLNAFLLEAHAAGLRVVLVIDEAQDLSAAALEQVRLLTNLETPTQKLLQIILLGQPELRTLLTRPELRQLAQRITARYHLEPLAADESDAYVRHRWAVAGGDAIPFTPAAMRRLHRHAGGVPRLLNVIADRALLAGYARGQRRIDRGLLDLAAREVMPNAASSRPPLVGAAISIALVALATVAIATAPRWWSPSNAPGAAALGTTPVVPAAATAAPARMARTQPPRTPVFEPGRSTMPPAPGDATSRPATLDGDAFARWLMANEGSLAPAWQGLLALWSLPAGSEPADDTSPCTALHAAGLLCASGRPSLGLLERFDRPALLHLRAGRHHAWVLLLGLGQDEALLRTEGHDVRVRRPVLEAVLDGQAVIARVPPSLRLPIREGDTGASVEWLQRALVDAAGPDAKALGPTNLFAALRARQRDLGLRADGIVGPETALALLAGGDGPHLRRLAE